MALKPVKRTRTFYEYLECRDYLQEKYGYDERDYASRNKAVEVIGKRRRFDGSRPYQDFWHWVVETYQIHNGCFVTFSRDADALRELPTDKQWVREIYQRYLDEFADEDGELLMFVEW